MNTGCRSDRGRRGHRAVVMLDDLLRLPVFEVVPPGQAETDAAYAAFVAYGKGSGHPAALNFGDIFSYALAKVRDSPLLFKGDDFAQTDIVSAISTEQRRLPQATHDTRLGPVHRPRSTARGPP
jgi:ribonuclease VapC